MRYLLVTMVLLSLSCSKKTESAEGTKETRAAEPSAAAPEAAPATEPSQPTAAAPKPAKVELLLPGEPPLVELRWKLAKGAKHKLQLRTKTSVQVQAGQQKMPETATPLVTYELEISVQDVTADGTARAAFTIEGAELEEREETPDALKTQLLAALAGLRGGKGRLNVSPRGEVTEIEVEASEGATSASLRMADGVGRMLASLTLPVPEEDVGKGAKWTVTREVSEAGIRADEVTTVELTSVDDGTVRAELETKKNGGPQDVTPPGEEGRTSFSLGDYSSSGHGTAVLKLSQLVPVSYETEASSIMTVLTRGRDGQPQLVNVMQKTKHELEGK